MSVMLVMLLENNSFYKTSVFLPPKMQKEWSISTQSSSWNFLTPSWEYLLSLLVPGTTRDAANQKAVIDRFQENIFPVSLERE